MQLQFIHPTGHSYSQAVSVTQFTRLVVVSGQVPATAEEKVPTGFSDQCRLVWANIMTQLHAAGLKAENIIKVTTFLSDRRYRQENASVRREVLGDHQPALTVIITGIYEEEWLLEIEVMAAE